MASFKSVAKFLPTCMGSGSHLILGSKISFFKEHFSGASVCHRSFLSLDIIFLPMQTVRVGEKRGP